MKQKGMYEQRNVFVRQSLEPSFAILRNEYQACPTYISPTFLPACAEKELNSDFCPDTFDPLHKHSMPQNTRVVHCIHLSVHPLFYSKYSTHIFLLKQSVCSLLGMRDSMLYLSVSTDKIVVIPAISGAPL